MHIQTENNPQKKDTSKEEEGYKNPSDVTPRREGGDDALAETSPDDSRSDEKVIYNDDVKKSSETA